MKRVKDEIYGGYDVRFIWRGKIYLAQAPKLAKNNIIGRGGTKEKAFNSAKITIDKSKQSKHVAYINESLYTLKHPSTQQKSILKPKVDAYAKRYLDSIQQNKFNDESLEILINKIYEDGFRDGVESK